MPTTIQFTKSVPVKPLCLIIPMIDGKPPKDVAGLDTDVLKYIKGLDDKAFDGKHGSCHAFSWTVGGALIWYVVVGVEKKATLIAIEKAGGKLYDVLAGLKVKNACCLEILGLEQNAALANGFFLKSYMFTTYKTGDKKKDDGIALKMVATHKANAEKVFAEMKTVSDAVFKARDLVSTPPNDLYPASYVTQIKSFLKGSGVKITVLDEKKLEKMGAGAILAVGKASVHPPRIVVMEYDGRKKKTKGDKPIAMVGKGVTYDTGGYSLKPPKSMEKMKMDMGGSAAVVAVIQALAINKVAVHAIGVVALAENMIAGNGYRVDDVLTSLSGQTIEVLNTDAEGRLCLADALTYVQKTYDPKAVVDIATLTGACMAALGLDMAGVFSNDKKLADLLIEAGEQGGDDLWALPVNDAFSKQLESPIADMANLGSVPFAGASTAAAFLQRFITDDRPWAHLDIAGPAWRQSASDLCPKGASGFGVRVLYNWAKSAE